MAVFKNGRIAVYTVYVIRFLTSKEMRRAEPCVLSRREVLSTNSPQPNPSSVNILWNTIKLQISSCFSTTGTTRGATEIMFPLAHK